MISLTAKEIADALGVTKRAISKQATQQGWAYKSLSVRGGKSKAYDLKTLPEKVQAAIALNSPESLTSSKTDVTPSSPDATGSGEVSFSYDREALWAVYGRKKASQKERAQFLLDGILAALELIQQGTPQLAAWKAVAEARGVSFHTLRYRAYEKCKQYRREDWLAALVPGHVGRSGYAKCDTAAWDFFLGDYLRLEQPSGNACYRRLERAAKEHGWAIPSVDALLDRVKRDVPLSTRILKREGEQQLMALYPAQHRSVRELHALEWINGDGYKHNVFVRFPDGTIARPKTWFWQDIYSRKVLAWRVDQTEHTDQLRLSFGDLVERFGIPQHCTIDNTRAAANKWMTGGQANRYRFKIRDDDPLGLLTTLGVQVHWTSVHGGKGHGQAKPIERAFGVGGIGEVVDKHPAFEGAYTGNNPTAKPENYGSRAIDLDLFIKVMEQEISIWNSRTKRRTEICGGVLSFDEAFNESYENSPICKPTDEQRRMWLLAAEGVLVQRNGTVTLDAGKMVGKGRNRYFNQALHDYAGQKVIVRFDPDSLHGDVHIYSLDNRFITTAFCLDDVGFGDTEAAREHNRARKQFVRASKDAAKAEERMTALEAAAKLPDVPVEADPQARVVRAFKPRTQPVSTPEPSSPEQQADLLEFRQKFYDDQEPGKKDFSDMNSIERHDFWKELDQRRREGDQLSEREERIWKGWQTTSDFKAYSKFDAAFAESQD